MLNDRLFVHFEVDQNWRVYCKVVGCVCSTQCTVHSASHLANDHKLRDPRSWDGDCLKKSCCTDQTANGWCHAGFCPVSLPLPPHPALILPPPPPHQFPTCPLRQTLLLPSYQCLTLSLTVWHKIKVLIFFHITFKLLESLLVDQSDQNRCLVLEIFLVTLSS